MRLSEEGPHSGDRIKRTIQDIEKRDRAMSTHILETASEETNQNTERIQQNGRDPLSGGGIGRHRSG